MSSPSPVTIRPFAAADLTPVVALWNRCLPKDPISEERFWRLFLLDANFDPEGALVAAQGGEVVGFLQAMYRRYPLGSLGIQPEQGWVTAFLVAPERRRQGIGTRLLDEALAYLRMWGRTRVLCNGYAPYYLFPGVDEEYAEAHAFLQARGFTPGAEAVAMGMSLEGVRTPDSIRTRYDELGREGFEVHLFRREDTLPLIAFVEEHFPHWTPSLLDGLRAGNEEVSLATWDNEVVAYTQWQNPHNDPPSGVPGRFGPFGVHPDLRGRGIGAIVFYHLIERVSGNGARYLWFGWAGGRNLSFYERAGCRVTRRFRLYGKTL
jgi:GNAT superfamily N-acetyltransferase